jgi:hypothetical protein
MTKTYRNLIIWTLISNLLIIVGIGHGVSPVFLSEFMLPFEIGKDFKFTLFGYGGNDNAVLSGEIIFFLGQVLLLVYLFLKRKVFIWLSLAILWFGLFPLFYDFGGIMLLFALPFIILSTFLFFWSFKINSLQLEDDFNE